ncbi:methylated-DNA--[protein]-cysteine S-methyltransferase [soil metagenome]
MRPDHLRLDHLASPIGEMLLVTDEAGCLRALDFHDHEPRMLRLLRRHYGDQPLETGAAPAVIRDGLDRYFGGALTALSTIPWATAGTDFQRRVWAALVDIPAGQTTTYSRLAARIGRPTAVRAMGAANGANPVGIVVPCHRVIGADGSLTGYGGGIARKRWLLAHEGAGA